MSNKKSKILKCIIAYYLVFAILSFISHSMAKYVTKVRVYGEATPAKFNFEVEDNKETVGTITKGTITLNDTVIDNGYNNKKVIPGSKGILDLNIDFTNIELDTEYTIEIEKENLPANLKFYLDSSMENELTNIKGEASKNETVVNKKIYWSWNFSETDESAYMESVGNVIVKVNVTQNTEE